MGESAVTTNREVLPDGGGSPPGRQVCAVIVSFHPDPARLQALVESVASQAQRVCIVDNGSAPECVARMRGWMAAPGLHLIELGENRGIAAAHNAGIRYAMAEGYAHVLLLDHDSRLMPGCVARLLDASARLLGAGVRLGAVGPRYHDETTGAYAPFLRFSRWNFRKVHAQREDEAVETSVLISSGSLIRREALDAIGPMDENLFIDGVDWEWCFRAISLGYRLYGIAGATMRHSLGDAGIRVLWRTLPLHGPLRHYYVYRNTVLMCRMPQIPFSWKLHFSLRLVVRFAVYMLLAPRRAERLRLIARGLRDGLAGRGGRIEAALGV